MPCARPFLFDVRKGDSKGVRVMLRCGKCALCRIDRQREWTQRFMWEYQTQGYKGHFVTLTYSDAYLPADRSLHYEDVQKFLKRLRRRLGSRRIKFYCAGEYGEESTMRPHWHIVIFGDVTRYEILKSWSFGRCDVRPFNRSRGRYTLKYLDKEEYLSDDLFSRRFGARARPMHHMSNGIGAAWIAANLSKVECGYLEVARPHGGTRKVPVPRYYREKYGLPSPEPSVDPVKAEQIAMFRAGGINYVTAYGLVYGAYARSVARTACDNYDRFMRYKTRKHFERYSDSC